MKVARTVCLSVPDRPIVASVVLPSDVRTVRPAYSSMGVSVRETVYCSPAIIGQDSAYRAICAVEVATSEPELRI